ncbi:MAG: hypothetical protein QM790_06570 [Nibricoccus sp.]
MDQSATNFPAPFNAHRFARILARSQGWFYLATGAWPLVNGETFQWVTGFKADFWLAQTVGALLCCSGGVLILAARFNRLTPEIALLGITQAIALSAIDVYTMNLPRTTYIYLIDAVAEAALVAAWIVTWYFGQNRAGPPQNFPKG